MSRTPRGVRVELKCAGSCGGYVSISPQMATETEVCLRNSLSRKRAC